MIFYLVAITLTVATLVVAVRGVQKLRIANLQMDLIASMSHELRSPLVTILCLSENMRDGLTVEKNDLRTQSALIADQADRLSRLIDQVLLLAQTTKGTPQYILRPLEVSEVLGSVLRNSQLLVNKSGFHLETNIEAGLPAVVGDVDAISHCLENLITNAIKYSDKDHWIGLSATIAETASHRKHVAIAVRDHGLGISTSDLGRVFEPFYRSPDVVAAHIRGTGLGLTIAKRTAEALGGRLSVVSELNVGSTFTLYLPTASTVQQPMPWVSRTSRRLRELHYSPGR